MPAKLCYKLAGGHLADVFISYARADQPIARRVAKALQEIGLQVWWDADLPPDRAYSDVIEHNLEEAKAVLVLWSKASAASQWVRAEADIARNAGKLVQAQLDGIRLPLPFNQVQCADLKGWRGSQTHPGWSKIKGSVDRLVSGKEEPMAAVGRGRWDGWRVRRWQAAAALALLLSFAAAALFLLRPAADERKPIVAVLPFRSLDARDESLVAGIWEDTRQAIGRNPQLVVLGPNTSQELAGKQPSSLKRAANYLVEASVRTAGDRIRVSTDLVRTSDGVQLWSQDFDGKADDVFALQSEIATEIEGRIRGRLAKKGGVRPEHIATTGELYALYSDARVKIGKEDAELYASAQDELRDVIRRDPNFAPAWASLATLYKLMPASVGDQGFDPADAEKFARKAIDLAPNLAAAHAALALALGLDGPVSRAEAQRAVELDPNDYESLMWLGRMYLNEGQNREALDASSQAAQIEPFFYPAVMTEYYVLGALGDDEAIHKLAQHERELGARHVAAALEMQLANSKGDLVRAAQIGLADWKTGGEGRSNVGYILWPILLQLGHPDEAWKVAPLPDFGPYLWANDPKGLDMVEAHHFPRRRLFSRTPIVAYIGRVYLLSGRGETFANMYLSLRPGEFEQLADDGGFVICAPTIGVALKGSGHAAEAEQLLAAAERAVAKQMQDGDPAAQANLARIYAVENRRAEAVSLLAAAVTRGWLPDTRYLLNDLHLDPALAGLRGDPGFERSRDQILARLKRYHDELGPISLNQA